MKTELLESQVSRLVNFIIENCPGYPNTSEGAIDCAMRIIKDLQLLSPAIDPYRTDEEIEEWARANSKLGKIYKTLEVVDKIEGAKAYRDNKIPKL